jgi:hypothetical protein
MAMKLQILIPEGEMEIVSELVLIDHVLIIAKLRFYYSQSHDSIGVVRQQIYYHESREARIKD